MTEAQWNDAIVRFPVLLVIAALLLIAAVGWRTVSTGEIWMHLTIGRQIAEEGIPRADNFSFMREGELVVASNWLYDVFIYHVHRIGGMGLLTAIHLLSVLSAFVLLLPLARKFSHLTTLTLALVMSAWLLMFRFEIAPYMFVMFIPALFLFMLRRDQKISLLWIVLLPLQWLWTNIHASFILGPVFCAITALHYHYYGKGNRQRKALTKYMMLAAACLAVTALNPYRFRIYAEMISLWRSIGQDNAQAWVSPLAGHFHYYLLARLVVLVLLIGAAGLITYRKRLPPLETIVAAGAAYTAVRSPTHVEWLAVLGFPFIALSLQSLADMMTVSLRRAGKTWLKRAWIITYVALVVLLFFSFSWVTSNRVYSAMGSASRFGVGMNRDLFPEDAALLIEQPGFPERALNFPIHGGYLRWHFPDRRVYCDQRTSLYGGVFLDQLRRALLGDDAAWQRSVDEPGVDAIILPGYDVNIRRILANLFAREWEVAYFDGTTVILLRKGAVPMHLLGNRRILQHGLDIVETERREYHRKLQEGRRPPVSARLIGASQVLFASGRVREAVSIADMMLNVHPNMASGWFLSGLGHLQLDEAEEAAKRFQRATRLTRRDGLAWLWLSRAYAQLERDEEADRAFRRALRLNPRLAESFGAPADVTRDNPRLE